MKQMQGSESIDWDSKDNCLVITKQERLGIEDTSNINGAKEKLKQRFSDIVQQVKGLKMEATRIKELLDKIEGKAGVIPPA